MCRLLLILVSICTRSLQAQEYTFQDEWLDHSAMLSNRNVLQLIQDFRGYTWVATADGLNRYDGTGIRTFFEDGSRDGLPSNFIYALLEYQRGKLLIGTSNGICILNTETGEFERNPIQVPALRSRSGKRICSFFKDSRSRIWVSHQDGYDILDINLKHIMRLSDQSWARDLQGSHVYYAGWKEDSRGRYWLPTDDAGIIIVDELNRTVQSWKTQPGRAPYFQRMAIRSFWLDEARQEAWYGPWGKGLVKYDLKRQVIQQSLFGLTPSGEQSTVNHIVPLNDSTLLCFTGNGPFFAHRSTLEYSRPPAWVYNNNRKFSIRHRLQDRLGNTWEWGSEGFYQIVRVRDSARLLALRNGKSQASFDMLQSGNQLYLSYYKNGLARLDLDRREFFEIQPPGGKLYSINNLAKGPGGSILASSVGIYRVDTLAGRFSPLAGPGLPFMNREISDIHTAPDGTVWWAALDTPVLGAIGARVGKSFFTLVSIPPQDAGDARPVVGIRHDVDGNLWMRQKWSTRVLCLNTAKGQWKIYRPPLHRIGLSHLQEISSLQPGAEGVLWFCNATGGGLIRFDTRSGKISQFQRKQGISSDIIFDICPDDQGNLFLKTSDGIDLFDVSKQEVIGFVPWTQQMSLPRAGSMQYDSTHQRLMFGSDVGVITLPRKLWMAKPRVPAVYIDRVMVSNQRIPFPGEGRPLVLQPGMNNLSLVFSAVNYHAGNELLFTYTLDKRDKDWSAPSPLRSANYTELPPGEYRFLVRVVTPSGRMGQITEFRVVILPYFWQTAWFLVLLIAALAGLAVWYFRSRINSLKQEAALQRRMAETEMDLLRSQINPHFIFNCLSAIDNLIQTHQVDRATTYLARFARMLRSVIESTRYDLLPIQKDIENLRNYILLEQFMSNGKFDFQIDTDPALEGSDVKVPPMIIQPFVENAIRHGLLNKLKGDRILRIGIALDQDLVRYSITDNGIGREAAAEINRINKRAHQSFGLQITADRIRLLNRNRETSGYSIRDLSEGNTATGTRVDVWIDTTPV